MHKLKTLVSLSSKSETADFVFVYILEAHATDEWFITGNPVTVAQHKTLSERIIAAKRLYDMRVPFLVTVDKMSNHGCVKYAAWPERIYVILDGEIQMIGDRRPGNLPLDQLREYLETFEAKQQD